MDKQYNIVLIIDNDPIYTPYIINKILNELDHNLILKCVIFTEGNYRKISNEQDNLERINLYGSFNNFMLNILYTYKERQIESNDNINYYKILNNKNIPYKVTDNINTGDIISFINDNNIDIIFSLTHHILKKDILNAPNMVCINRHTGKLPEYAGLQPVLYAMLNQKNESSINITLTYHTMVEQIDAGLILAEKTYELSNNTSLYGAYSMQYHDVITLFNTAVNNYLNKQYKNQDFNNRKYYSFPNKDTCAAFRKHFKIYSFYEYFNNMNLK